MNLSLVGAYASPFSRRAILRNLDLFLSQAEPLHEGNQPSIILEFGPFATRVSALPRYTEETQLYNVKTLRDGDLWTHLTELSAEEIREDVRADLAHWGLV